jgi:SAM-dependent methyltransferase
VTAHDKNAKAPIRNRVLAWWHGLDLSAEPKKAGGKRASKAVERPPEPIPLSTRVEVVQAMWGSGNASPCGAEFITHLGKPLRLNEKISVLDVGAGLGGADRDLCKSFGTWIDGLEADRELVSEGAHLAKKLGMEKRATLSVFDPEIIEFPERKYDRVISKETWCTVKDKDRLLKQVLKTLRAKGELLLVDFVVGDKPGAKSRLDAGLAADGRIRAPWPASAYVEALKVNGLEVRVADDISDMYLQVIGKELLRLHGALKGDPNFEPNEVLTRELTVWMQRIELMRDENLRMYRFHALKANAPKPLSNW